jgi:hypothetical protein
LYVNNNWVDYTYGSGSGTLTKYIAPLQAFFIETTGVGTANLLFPPDLVSVTRPGNKLRSSNQDHYSENVLYAEASNLSGQSWLTIGLNKAVAIDVQRLFNFDPLYEAVPQIYAVRNGKKNSVQFTGEETEIPIGVQGNSSELTTLRFHNLEQMHVQSLQLYDQVTDVTYDLLREVQEVQFFNSPGVPNRFLLRIGKQTTGIDKPTANGIRISTHKNRLFVHADETIDHVTVVNALGLKVADFAAINKNSMSTELNAASGIYIVKVVLANGKTKISKVLLMP